MLQTQREHVRILLPQRVEAVLETMVNTSEKAGLLLRLGVLACFDLGAHQVHDERRNEGSREEIGRQQSKDDGFGQRDEEITGHTRQEKHRDEHDADAQGRHECRDRNLLRSIQNALVEILPSTELPLDVLDGDRGIVDENANRQRQAAQGHDVDGFSDRAQHQQRRQDGKRNGNRDDQRAPPTAEEHENHQRRESSGYRPLTEHAL